MPQRSLTVVERFDPLAGTWELLPPMLEARSAAAAAEVAGKLYVCGGHGGRGGRRTAEVFDPTLRVWTQLPQMPYDFVGGWALGSANKLYLCHQGSRPPEPPPETHCLVQRFNPDTAAWDHLTVPRSFAAVAMPSVAL
eukprot:gnl/TRDRNA2_/TRDRNA2_118202_c3_seq1.p1 gnl/TRDRNA2_/TRDRNA2_118202_c3~~gnl/TRDRNA2_/TRDRNA2_118202_c3_seq1.p1  ORF type:complete len:138 (+),score=22.08 gnl/TRDRNA2_/TRDRNA2_118202_c3_seq1:3-416(+)